MKKTQGILFILAFVFIGSVFTTPIYGRVVAAITKGGTSDIRTLSENDGCDEDDDDEDDHAE